jgi:hypothetical protein
MRLIAFFKIKLVGILLIQFCTGLVFADSLSVSSIQPNWSADDTYLFQRVKINNFYLEDSLVQQEQTVDLFHIKIEQTTTHHIIKFYNDPDNFQREKVEGLDTEKLLLYKLIEDIAYEMSSFPYRFQLNDSLITYEPTVINKSDYTTHLKVKIDAVFDRYKEVLNKSEEEMENLKLHAKNYMLEQEKEVQNKLIHNLKHLFSAYNYPCKLDSTIRQEIETKEIALFSEQPFQPIKATENISLKKDDSVLTLENERIYDKGDFLRKIKLVQPVFANVKPDQLTVIERKTMNFEVESNWLTRTTSEAIALFPGVKVVQVTTIQRIAP